MEFELVYFEAVAQHFSDDAKRELKVFSDFLVGGCLMVHQLVMGYLIRKFD